MPKLLIYFAACILLLGALPMPYGYYMPLRLVGCGVFICAAFITYDRNEDVLPWVFGVLAILFNPIFKVHLPKELWTVVDVCSSILLLAARKKLLANQKADT